MNYELSSPATVSFLSRPSPQNFHSIATCGAAEHFIPSPPIPQNCLLVLICVIVKHAPKVFRMKEMDVVFTCWCRFAIKVTCSFPRESRKIFVHPRGMESRNICFYLRRNPGGSMEFLSPHTRVGLYCAVYFFYPRCRLATNNTLSLRGCPVDHS